MICKEFDWWKEGWEYEGRKVKGGREREGMRVEGKEGVEERSSNLGSEGWGKEDEGNRRRKGGEWD